jgi:hypothetical protein
MCRFANFSFSLPIPGFSLGLPRYPSLSIEVDIGIPLRLRTFGFTVPAFGFSLGLPRYPSLSFDVDIGIPLRLRTFGFTVPAFGFSLVPIRIIEFIPPICPLE